MNDEPRRLAPTPAIASKLQQWIALRDRLRELHAQLETMRLMMKLQLPRR